MCRPGREDCFRRQALAAIKTNDGKRHRLLSTSRPPSATVRSAGSSSAALLLIAAIAVGTTIMAGNFRERALDNSERELENTVLLLARHFDQQLEDFGVVQNDLIAYMRVRTASTAPSITSADVQPGHPPDAQGQDERIVLCRRHQCVRCRRHADQFVVGLAGSACQHRGPALFQGLQDRTRNRRTCWSSRCYGRITGAWTTVIARKVTGPNGEFLGAIGRGIEPANFEKFFATVALGRRTPRSRCSIATARCWRAIPMSKR